MDQVSTYALRGTKVTLTHSQEELVVLTKSMSEWCHKTDAQCVFIFGVSAERVQSAPFLSGLMTKTHFYTHKDMSLLNDKWRGNDRGKTGHFGFYPPNWQRDAITILTPKDRRAFLQAVKTVRACCRPGYLYGPISPLTRLNAPCRGKVEGGNDGITVCGAQGGLI